MTGIDVCHAIAKAYAKTVEITEASLIPGSDEDYALGWEEAFDQSGADPELKLLLIALLEKQQGAIFDWVERHAGAPLPEGARP